MGDDLRALKPWTKHRRSVLAMAYLICQLNLGHGDGILDKGWRIHQ